MSVAISVFTARLRRGALLTCVLALSVTAQAQTATETPSLAAKPNPDSAQPKPLVEEKKLGFLVERSARKARQSNPARPDKPQEAVNWFVGKRTGPIITRGPGAGGRPIGLDTALYRPALQAARQTPFYESRTGRVMAPGRTGMAISAAAGAALGAWQNMGPTNQGGRTRQLLIDPSNPSVMYAAAVGGGVWKSTNAGASWVPLTDLLLPNIAVASLAMDPRNPQVLYAGTGEGFFNFDAITGAGIFKTTDGGATWTALAATTPPPGATQSDFSYVNQIVVSPRDSNRVYAATRNGVFRSTDGGTTWTLMINGTSVNGCTDLALQTRRTVGYLYAACGTFAQATIYRALDSATSALTAVYTEAGMGRTSLAIAPSNENVIYALAANSSTNGMHAVLRSTTGGAAGSWTARVRSTAPVKLNSLQLTNPVYAYAECVGPANAANYNQGWYDNVIAVDPTNSERVWTGGIDLMRSDDGGQNWGVAGYWWFNQGHPNYVHADQHVIRFHPGYNGTTNKQMYVANDGGVFRTNDAQANVGTTVNQVCGTPASGMVTWTELNTNYTTTQYYHGATYPDGNTFLGGMQDNGTWRGTTASPVGQKLLGGDGGYVSVDTLGDVDATNDVLFSGYTGLSLQKSVNGGTTFADAFSGINDNGFAFIAPHQMNAGNRQVLYTGGWFIWRTNNQAGAWTQASTLTAGDGSISSVSSSPVDANRVLVGMSDGYIHSTATGLSNTSATNWPVTRPRTAFVSAIAHHPTNALVAYATFSTFSGVSVYKTSDGGASWVAMPGTGANVLPRVPATAVVVDPSDGQRVYVGTDIGVYTTVDGGANWYREVTTFGHVSVEALDISTVGDTKFLYAFTHGRGAWRVQINP